MKRIFPYFIFSTISIVVIALLSIVFKFSLSNTWQGVVAIFPIFGPYYVFFWKLAGANKQKHPGISFFVRFYIILTIIAIPIAIIAIIAISLT